MLGSAESEMVRLISREIIFAEFQPMWSRYLNVTNGRMDGQLALAISRYAVKTTLTADEILQCHYRAGESWPADCSKAAVQLLQSSGFRCVGPWNTTRVDVGRL